MFQKPIFSTTNILSMMLVKSTANTSSNSRLTTNFEKYKYVQCLLIFEIHLSIISCRGKEREKK